MKCRMKEMQKTRYRASMTVETAYLMPLFFLMFILIMRMTFYFHDKTVLYGAAYETAAEGIEKLRGDVKEESGLSKYFHKRLGRKMIYFGYADENITVSDEEIIVEASASRKRMGISVCVKMPVTKPEKQIRMIQGLKNAAKRKTISGIRGK